MKGIRDDVVEIGVDEVEDSRIREVKVEKHITPPTEPSTSSVVVQQEMERSGLIRHVGIWTLVRPCSIDPKLWPKACYVKLFRVKAQELKITRPASLPCPNCKKTFSSRRLLSVHLNTHNFEPTSKRARPRRKKCVQCKKAFFWSCDLARHIRDHQFCDNESNIRSTKN